MADLNKADEKRLTDVETAVTEAKASLSTTKYLCGILVPFIIGLVSLIAGGRIVAGDLELGGHRRVSRLRCGCTPTW